MKRKIYGQLLDWKDNRSHKEALLIDGARRVGKSWIVEDFARREYESYILIDFSEANKAILDLFHRQPSQHPSRRSEIGHRIHSHLTQQVCTKIQKCSGRAHSAAYGRREA